MANLIITFALLMFHMVISFDDNINFDDRAHIDNLRGRRNLADQERNVKPTKVTSSSSSSSPAKSSNSIPTPSYHSFTSNESYFNTYTSTQKRVSSFLAYISTDIMKNRKTKFDVIKGTLYNLALFALPHTTDRQEFTKDTLNSNSNNYKTILNNDVDPNPLNDNDRVLLGRIFYKVNSVFEYGIGESTFIAKSTAVSRYTGVEVDPHRIISTRKMVLADHFRYYLADVGKIKDNTQYNEPLINDLSKNMYNYMLSPLLLEEMPFDFYSVRGVYRYRVGCVCISFLHALKHGVEPWKILVGIYNDKDKNKINEEDSKGLKSIANIQLESDKYKLFQLKNQTSEKAVFQIWESIAMKSVSPSIRSALKSHYDKYKDKVHMFDLIAHFFYSRATKSVEIPRKKFDLKTWKYVDKSGGLDSDDRVSLGTIYYNIDSVFEWGLGESTYIAANAGVARYAGIDSDGIRIAQARDHANLHHFRYYFGDIGEIEKYGHPTKTLEKSLFDYQIAPLITENKPFDFYFVDGRYRVACACISFLHAMKYGGDMSKVMVGIHDYYYVSRGYKVLESIAYPVVTNARLYVFKLKKSTTDDQIFRLWREKALVVM